MRKPKVIINFTKFSDSRLDTLAKIIVENGKAHIEFQFASGTLAAVEVSSKEFTNSLGVAATGTSADVSEKNAKKIILQNCLHKYGEEINFNFEGNLTMLLKTGIPLVGDSVAKSVVVAVGLLVSYITGRPGCVKLKIWKKGRYGTVFAYTLAANAPARIEDWTLVHVNSSTHTIEGLIIKETYLFSAACQEEGDGDLVWHDIVPKIIV